jgi:hypothetical protein
VSRLEEELAGEINRADVLGLAMVNDIEIRVFLDALAALRSKDEEIARARAQVEHLSALVIKLTTELEEA